jgi:proton-coupled amino acid transporter
VIHGHRVFLFLGDQNEILVDYSGIESAGLFLIDIDAQVLPLKNEMKNPNNFNKPLGVLNVGMVIVGTMFVAMGFLSYLKYGDAISGSVTLNLDSSKV